MSNDPKDAVVDMTKLIKVNRNIDSLNDVLTAKIIKKYQEKAAQVMSIGEFKVVGREFRDKFNLSDRDTIDLLNNKNILEILSKYEN